MKSMITMMNAMKFYKNTDLVHEREHVQKKLSQDMSLPAYQKLVDRIRAKHFLNRG